MLKTKKLNEIKQYTNFWDIIKNNFDFLNIFKIMIVIGIFVIIIYFSTFAFSFGKKIIKNISMYTLQTLSAKMGEEVEKDDLGQLNILIAGYGGGLHDGGLLTDTIMIASYNPKLGATTFLSIPRDLYVNYNTGYYGRINGLFATSYLKDKNYNNAAVDLQKKITEITGIPIKYYTIIDFNGFIKLVDNLGGLDIDVPMDLVDTQYPNENRGYTTFKISKGLQKLNGETALKYARSRHSTSDFSRALRQQQVIRAILNKILSSENMMSIGKIQQMYSDYNKLMTSNISLRQILGLVKYSSNLKYFFNFVLSSDCNFTDYKLLEPGCLLYNPPREDFGGNAIILPQGAGSNGISFYKKIQDFAFWVVYNQQFLLENPKIAISNGISKKVIKRKFGYSHALAQDLALALKVNGFNISETNNTSKSYEKTVLYINGTGNYNTTVNLLKIFINFQEVLTGKNEFKNDLNIILGNDFIQ